MALISKVRNLCAKEQFGIFSQEKRFLIMYFEREAFRRWAKFSEKVLNLSIFVCRGLFGTLFPLNFRIFARIVSLIFQGFGRNFFSSVFSNMSSSSGREPSCFFGSSFFFSEPEFFLSEFQQKWFRQFWQNREIRVQTNSVVTFFQNVMLLFRTVGTNFSILDQKHFSSVFESTLICAQERSRCFFPRKMIFFLGLWTLCFWQVEWKKWYDLKTAEYVCKGTTW